MSHTSVKKIFSKAALGLLLIVAGFTLSACGKRAAHVDPPPGLDKDEFIRVYPDPDTDPK